MRRGLDAFHEDADAWRAAVGARARVYDRLLAAAAEIFDQSAGGLEEAARARVEAAWRERRFSAGYDRPLLLMAALRAEALRAGPRHPLYEAIAATDVRPEAATREALATALADAPPRLYAELATRRVQTNETSRAVAWLWPAALAGCADGKRPLALFDVGCSAGLNLCAERLPAPWRDPAGAPIPSRRRRTSSRATASTCSRSTSTAATTSTGCAPASGLARTRASNGWPPPSKPSAQPPWTDAAATGNSGSGGRPRAPRTARPGRRFRDRVARLPDRRPGLPDRRIPGPLRRGDDRWVEAETAGGPRRIWIELEAAPDAWKDPGGLPMALDAHVADGAARRRDPHPRPLQLPPRSPGARCRPPSRCSSREQSLQKFDVLASPPTVEIRGGHADGLRCRA